MGDSTLYKKIFENTTNGILLLDSNNLKVLTANPAACDFFGFSNNEIISKKVTEIVPEHVYKKILKIIDSQVKDFVSYEIDVLNGTVKDIKMFINPLDIDGKRMVQITILDIILEENKNQEKYYELMELLPLGIFVTVKGRFVFTNKAALEMLGAENASQVLGKHMIEFSPHTSESYNVISQRRKKIYQNQEPVGFIERQIKRLDGTTLDVEVASYPIIYEEQKAALSVVKDISERKIIERLRQYAKKEEKIINELREYDRLKTQFFSNISHEFKTPLNIILGTIQLLNNIEDGSDANPKYNKMQKYINMMRQNCYRLLRLVNNLIDITKYDVGSLKIDYKNYNIVAIVEDISLSVAEHIKSKGLSITFDTEIEEKIICCDAYLIERVILNLFSNAIKFTDVGGNIYINIYDRGDYIQISIKDDGIGISQDMINIVFEPFKQVDSSLNRRAEGSGIGLSLVKAIVDAHDGNIAVNSKIGEGSEFIISLPVRLVEEEKKDNLSSQITSTTQSKVERINIEFSDIYY